MDFGSGTALRLRLLKILLFLQNAFESTAGFEGEGRRSDVWVRTAAHVRDDKTNKPMWGWQSSAKIFLGDEFLLLHSLLSALLPFWIAPGIISLRGTERGKVQENKSPWECQRNIRKLVNSIATGYFFFRCSTTCLKTQLETLRVLI